MLRLPDQGAKKKTVGDNNGKFKEEEGGFGLLLLSQSIVVLVGAVQDDTVFVLTKIGAIPPTTHHMHILVSLDRNRGFPVPSSAAACARFGNA
jgi:hypothetical protein